MSISQKEAKKMGIISQKIAKAAKKMGKSPQEPAEALEKELLKNSPPMDQTSLLRSQARWKKQSNLSLN